MYPRIKIETSCTVNDCLHQMRLLVTVLPCLIRAGSRGPLDIAAA